MIHVYGSLDFPNQSGRTWTCCFLSLFVFCLSNCQTLLLDFFSIAVSIQIAESHCSMVFIPEPLLEPPNSVAAPKTDCAGKNAIMTSLPKTGGTKHKETNTLFRHLGLSCGEISPLPSWEMVQKQTATGQDVVTLSLHYLQTTSQTADHNKSLSYHSPI